MKISSESKTFQPITIVLETREEALCLWHRLNIGTGAFEEYDKRNSINMGKLDEEAKESEMWRRLSRELSMQGITPLTLREY